jgi:glycosyltransferase involved in cell wall biosynthesis
MKTDKIAIVYDWLDSWGGVERLLIHLHSIFPNADWYSANYDQEKASWVSQSGIKNIKTSFLSRLPKFILKHRIFLTIFYPFAFESFDFSNYDKVLIVSSSFAKGVITRPETKSYLILLTPTRWLFDQQKKYETSSFLLRLLRPFGLAISSKLREWDYIASYRPDFIFSISKIIQKRTLKYYKRKSMVLYPPFDYKYWYSLQNKICKPRTFFLNNNNKKFFLCVSRLEPYKKCDLLISAFNKNKENLVIVGTGRQKSMLKAMAKSNITFLENIKDEELGWLYSNASAVLMPQEEDFGYVALEAQSFNCPIISYSKGGVSEIIHESLIKYQFFKQTESSIVKAVADFNKDKYNVKIDEIFFKKFSVQKFQDTLLEYLKKTE